MKYLNFSEEEIRIFKTSNRKKVILLYLSFSLLLLLVAFFLPFLVYPPRFFGNFMEGLSLFESLLILLPFIAAILIPSYIWFYEISLKRDIKANKKKIYLGVVAEKKHKVKNNEERYYLYMDGKKFRVSKKEFYSFEKGDPAEFHVSWNGKHLFKVTAPTVFVPANSID